MIGVRAQATTVGYGDVSNSTQPGRLWACVHILVSVALLGELIQTFDELRAKRAKTMARIRMLTTRLTEPMLDHLLEHATVLRPRVRRDGLGLTELEFVLVRIALARPIGPSSRLRSLPLPHCTRLRRTPVRAAWLVPASRVF